MRFFSKLLIFLSSQGFCLLLQAEVDFVHQIVPVLREHCVECHGEDEAKGGFSMNTRELFLEDDMAKPGDSSKSEFLLLIQDTDPEYQMPPEKKKRVPAAQVALLKKWIDEGMPWTAGFTFAKDTYEPPLKPKRPELPSITDGRENPVDRLIDAYFAEKKVERPGGVNDEVFLRRVSMDLTGLLPSVEEVQAFLKDESPDKRTRKIAELLGNEVPYAEHWLTFWNDLLRNDYAGTGFITKGRTQISEWLYQSLVENKPFDQFATELIAPPSLESAGYINGIKWRGEVSAGQTVEIQFAQSISQSFLGINMKCASCHDSFIDRWKLTDAYGLAAIYAEKPLEIHRCDKPVGETAKAAWLFPELGSIDVAAPKEERLKQLAGLMTHPENGRFTRTIVNRLWTQLIGRGIVHPLDAMQTEPWNEDLLDFLASDFQEHGYDLKHTLRLIAESEIYQAKIEKNEGDGSEGSFTFEGPLARRLTSEQFIDAVWQVSGAAPGEFDAPVSRGSLDPEEVKRFKIDPKWIWGKLAAATLSPAGEKLIFRKEILVKKKIASAGLVATGDNQIELFLNGQSIAKSGAWHELSEVSVTKRLREGGNRIIVIAQNGGDTPNMAGLFAAVRILYEDGTEELVSTGGDWKVCREIPKEANVSKWKLNEMTWETAVPVTVANWEKDLNPKVAHSLASASKSTDLMVRASLLKSDFLMRSLGRPNRDQIVSSRPSELTTLEAVDLSNSEALAEYFQKAASRFDGEDAVPTIFLATLTRMPTEGERVLIRETLGENPAAEGKADLLWSIFMSPEFFFVR